MSFALLLQVEWSLLDYIYLLGNTCNILISLLLGRLKGFSFHHISHVRVLIGVLESFASFLPSLLPLQLLPQYCYVVQPPENLHP